VDEGLPPNPLLLKEGELENLKQTLQSSGVPYRRFSDPEELGEQVFQDILGILDRDFPQARQLTPLERERIEHEAYSRNRRQSYVANPEYYEAFVKHVESEGPPLIIWGRSGLGKSALMAYLAHEYETQNPNAFVVQHFIGAAEGSDPEDVMRQVMMEIKERYALTDAIPTDDNALREEFPVWLAKVGSNPLVTKESTSQNPLLKKEGESDKLILLIDALNQLTGIAPELHWLPEFIPTNVRLVVSTTSESLPIEQLRKRNWNELELQPLTEQQREAISRDFLKRYRKSLAPQDLHTLSANPKSSSPLFLRTVLEELRIFGHHQSLHEQLSDYLASADERELFQKVLARMERDHGEESVRNVMTAISASRHGLSESELMDITGKPRMALSELMIAMEYHLMTREGFHTFFHNYLREAVELRYLPNEAKRHIAHAELGAYFATREYGHRRRDEEPWQWQEADMADRLSQTLSDPEILLELTDQQHIYQYLAYWRGIEDKVDIVTHFKEELAELAPKEIPERFVKIALGVTDYFVASSQFLAAQSTLDFTRESHPEVSEENSEKILGSEAAVLIHLGEYQEALLIYTKLRAIYETRPDSKPELIDTLLSISTIQYRLAEYNDALANSLIARDSAVAIENISLIVDTLTNASACMAALSDIDGAIAIAREALETSKRGLGAEHPKTLNLMINLGQWYRKRKQWREAEYLFTACEDIIGRTLGKQSEQYVSVIREHAALKFHEQKYEDAIEFYERIIEVYHKRAMEENHPELIRTALSLGSTFFYQENLVKALEIYNKYFPMIVERLGESHPDVLQFKVRYESIRTRKKQEDALQASS
jgi:nephrocystin-3